METQNIHIVEGQPIDRPPLFDGTNYKLWSIRMSTFIKAYDYEVWDVIMDGSFVPSKSSNARRKKKVAKERSEWSKEDKMKVQVNFKAMNVLHCALSQSMFEQISTCSNAKEIWEKLKEDYSTPNVEESKAKVEDSLCLMVKEDEIKVIPKLPLSFNSDDFNCNDYSDHDDIEDDYESLYNDFNNLASKYLSLKKKVKQLTSELEKIKNDFQNVFDDRSKIQENLDIVKSDYIVLKVDLESKNMVLKKNHR